MRKNKVHALLSLLLCLMLLAAAVPGAQAEAKAATETEIPEAYVVPATDLHEEITISLLGSEEAPVALGEGKTAFLFTVRDLGGHEFWFEIHSDAEFLSQALLDECYLIAGQESEWGLFVTDVCGFTADGSEEHPGYWMLYIDDKLSEVGVDLAPVAEGAHYLFQIETF